MDQYTRHLTEIMHKIAFKVPWEKLKLGENELKVLDKATGDEMVEIAYKNRIPFSKFIHNADELIDEFNEHKFKQYIKDVKELKNALEEPFKCKETREIQIEPIQVDPLARERELMQAAINEVLEGQFNDDATLRETVSDGQEKLADFVGNFFNVNGPEVEPVQQPKIRDFTSTVVSHNELGTSISLQRHDFASRYLESSFIDTHLRGDPLNQNEDAFGEATFDDLAQLGMFDGSRGRELFNKLYEQSVRPMEEPPSEGFQRNQTVPELPSIGDIEAPLNNNINNNNMEIPQLPDILPQVDPSINAPVDPSINLPVDQSIHPPENQSINAPVDQPNNTNQAKMSEIPNAEQSFKPSEVPQLTASDISYAARLARLEKAPSVNEDEVRVSNQQKPGRKPRVHRPNRILGSEPVVNIVKPLLIQPKKPIKMRKEPNRVAITLKNVDADIWEIINNIDKLPIYQVPNDNEINPEEIANLNSAIVPQQMEFPQIDQLQIMPELPQEASLIQPEIPMDIQPINQEPLEEISSNKRAITSPEHENVSKRRRVAIPINPQTPSEFLQNVSFSNVSTTEPVIRPEDLNLGEVPPIDPIGPLPDNVLNEPEKSAQTTNMSFDPNDMVLRDAREKSASINIQPQMMLNASTPSGSSFKTPLSIQPQKRTADILDGFRKFRNKLNITNVDESRVVTPQDIIFGQLRNISKDTTLPPPPPALSDITIQPNEATLAAPSALDVPPENYREFKKNGVEFIQFQNNQGKVVQFEEYNIQNMLLYLQVRKYMKMKNTTKLDVPQLLEEDILKIKNVKSKHTIKVRLWRLCDRGLFMGEWSDDDEFLAIELPHAATAHTVEEQDKENIP